MGPVEGIKREGNVAAHDEHDDANFVDDVDEFPADELHLDEDDGVPAWRRRTALVMLVAGLIGLFTSFVLSIEAWMLARDSGAAFGCDVSQVVSCGLVARSWQAELLGFPNAFLGIFFESVVLTVSVALTAGLVVPRWFIRGVLVLYTIALGFSLWLFLESYFVIHALCPWCLLITTTSVIVWSGLARIAIRDQHVPAPVGMRQFVASGADWFIAGAAIVVLGAMILLRYGTRLFGV